MRFEMYDKTGKCIHRNSSLEKINNRVLVNYLQNPAKYDYSYVYDRKEEVQYSFPMNFENVLGTNIVKSFKDIYSFRLLCSKLAKGMIEKYGNDVTVQELQQLDVLISEYYPESSEDRVRIITRYNVTGYLEIAEYNQYFVDFVERI